MDVAAPDSLSGDDAPERMRHDGLFWRRLAYRGCIYPPEFIKRILSPITGIVTFGLLSDNRRGAVANLQRVLGKRGFFRDHFSAFKMFLRFAEVFRETCEVQHAEIVGLDIEKAVDIELPPGFDIENVFPRDKGVVVLTSHFGCWEIGARVMRRFDRPVNIVMAHEANASVQAFQDEMRERSGVKVIYSDDSPFASVEMLRALERGEIVAIQLDRAAPGQVTREVEFFGEKAAFQVGPFHLARAAGVPLWPVFAVQQKRRKYRLLPAALKTIPRGDDEALDAVMQTVVGLFEDRVRQFPSQWFQFRDFWATETP